MFLIVISVGSCLQGSSKHVVAREQNEGGKKKKRSTLIIHKYYEIRIMITFLLKVRHFLRGENLCVGFGSICSLLALDYFQTL